MAAGVDRIVEDGQRVSTSGAANENNRLILPFVQPAQPDFEALERHVESRFVRAHPLKELLGLLSPECLPALGVHQRPALLDDEGAEPSCAHR